MRNTKQPFATAVLSGDTKTLLTQALEFLLDHAETDINSFLLDNNGYLVFCKTYPNQKNIDAISYPFKPNATVLAEHAFQYLSELTPEQRAAMGATPDGSEESYEYGWELFIPDEYSDDYGIASYRDGTTILAVKPKLIEYGK